MITVLLQQILDLLTAHFPGVISLLEKLNLIEPDVEEIRQDVDSIRNTTNMVNSNIQLVYIQSRYIKDNTDLIKTDTANISSKTDQISNNIGTISTNTGRAASFAEDCANNTLDIDQKITSIASDTTQMRADNQVLINNTNDIESYLLAMSYGIIKTTAAKGNPINFNTDLIEELPIVRAEISPILSSSDTPTPDNPITITGTSSLDVVMNGETTSISLGGTVGKAELDIINGSGRVTYDIYKVTGNETNYSVTTGGYIRFTTPAPYSGIFSTYNAKCNICNVEVRGQVTNKYTYLQTTYFATVADFQNYLLNNDVYIIYMRITPSTLSTTPATFTSVPGDNQISANANADLTITYKESVANYIANNT